MAKKERLGSDPLSFIKDTRIQPDTAPVPPEPAVEDKSAAAKTDANKEKDDTKFINAENLSMQVKKIKSGRASISFEGEMTIYNIRQIKNVILEGLNEHKGIELDLSMINKIDTAGFQVIIAARKDAASREKSVNIVNPAAEVKKLFQLYGEIIV